MMYHSSDLTYLDRLHVHVRLQVRANTRTTTLRRNLCDTNYAQIGLKSAHEYTQACSEII